MFLEATLKNNPELVHIAAKFHRDGLIPPNTYCIDLDMVKKNARKIAEAGKEYGVKLYFMTKQFGRNPLISRAIVQAGIEKAVAVDMDEARILYKHGIKIGHLGHLVQIPQASMREALRIKPEVITCFSLEKVKEVNEAARELGRRQDILLRVIDEGDYFYPGQEGGIKLTDLEEAAYEIKKLAHVSIVGVTSFPCFLYNEETRKIEPTNNAFTIRRAADILKALGFSITQLNGPSVTCVSSLPILKGVGITHGEPGHALTGTTPLHSQGEEPEGQAVVYVTEVSHRSEGKAYVFGGGFYPRSRIKKAYIPERDLFLDVEEPVPDFIDYYVPLITRGNRLAPGDTVIFSFRTQAFVTRSKIAVIDGIQSGNSKLLGLFNALGDEVNR